MGPPAPRRRYRPGMRPALALALTAGTLVFFAANSLLARAALGSDLVDPATFTSVRLASGAASLALIAAVRGGSRPRGAGWGPALALFAYAAAFSLAYVRIRAGTGALLLFASVQATMIGWSVWRGARPTPLQWAGVGIALAGVAWLTLPGADAPDLVGALLMAAAGAAWGAYTLFGRSGRDPVADTAGNFLRATALTAGLSLLLAGRARATPAGIGLAAASGALASGVGYSLWYTVVPRLGATRAAAVQLAVPILAAAAAVAVLGEPFTARLGVAGLATLAGIALALLGGARPPAPPR